MSVLGTYIQQLRYDGTGYVKGSVVDLLNSFNIVCQDFPFTKNPEPKELSVRDWVGEDGLDVYVPDVLPMKHYNIDVVFLYVGTEKTIRADISRFVDFICGRSKALDSDTVKSGRLAIYNEYVGIGRKDVVVSKIDNDLFFCSDADPDSVARFNVTFTVYDPTTEVSPVFGDNNGVKYVTDLQFIDNE